MASMPRYAIGDSIVLKGGFVRTEQASRTCRIAAILPSDGSRAQYRVRFEGENFDRRILESDIDMSQSASPTPRDDAVADIQGGSWLKTSSLRVRK
ncbi:cold-shock protein [Rhizobium grahamii]|uniref:Cold-shock protein n=1 Tax=Rhizobium grahamii TaxID=1120045 RepID=A0A370KKZ6_9HYPH|nr:cold-shock protein [Rhizobium grahamii]